jgi:DNA-binding transcriptional regulator/RsmH inhibitor MraZ
MEKRTMLLTRKMLNTILRNYRVQIPAELKNELLEKYGNLIVTEEVGRVMEYSEQDICEQLRKIVQPYENASREVNNFMLI